MAGASGELLPQPRGDRVEDFTSQLFHGTGARGPYTPVIDSQDFTVPDENTRCSSTK